MNKAAGIPSNYFVFGGATLIVIIAAIMFFSNPAPKIPQGTATTSGTPTVTATATPTVTPTATLNPTPTQPPLSWKQYTLKTKQVTIAFMYPSTATVTADTQLTSGKCDKNMRCGTLTVKYQQLSMRIEFITGIGGVPMSPTGKFKVVAGTVNNGVIKIYDENNLDNTVNYCKTEAGGITFCVMDPSFVYPQGQLATYESVMDGIGTTWFGYKLTDVIRLKNQKYVRAYHNSVHFFYVDPNTGKETIVYSPNKALNETPDNCILSPKATYAVFETMVNNGNGGYYLDVYNLDTQKMIKFGTSQKVVGSQPIWTSSTTFEYRNDSTGKTMIADVSKGTTVVK